jgi:hypothetical protein
MAGKHFRQPSPRYPVAPGYLCATHVNRFQVQRLVAVGAVNLGNYLVLLTIYEESNLNGRHYNKAAKFGQYHQPKHPGRGHGRGQ